MPSGVEGAIVGTITVIHDVSERVRNEAAMRHQIQLASGQPALPGQIDDPLQQRDAGTRIARDAPRVSASLAA